MAHAAVALVAMTLPVTLADSLLSVGTAIPVPPPGGSGIPRFCSLPSERGTCDDDLSRYFFQPSLGCQPFQYGGCDGNANNFESLAACEDVCLGLNLPVCEQPKVPGPCKGSFRRWAYDQRTGQCEEFIYGGCGGNNNNFESLAECQAECSVEPVPVCEQPTVPGPCRGSFRRWAYDQRTGQCEEFIYGGCGGNNNNFESLAECQAECSVEPVPVCEQPVEIGPCDGAFPRWAFDVESRQCFEFSFGGCQGNGNNFETRKECVEECGEPAGAVCELRIDPGPCRASIPRWGFDGEACVPFTYGGCRGNGNNFESLAECQAACGGDVCGLPLVVGPCEALVPVWGFQGGQCVQWTYGGCGGNGNRFDSEAECEAACGGSVDICTLPIFPPDQLVFCRAAIPRWTYNAKKGACEEFIYSGCGGTANIFETEKECVAACGSRVDRA